MSEEWKELLTIGQVAEAQALGMEIESTNPHADGDWSPWLGNTWHAYCTYRARLRQSKEHELKTDSQVFDAVLEGRKTFEIRKDGRGFSVGDLLKLRRTLRTGEEMKKGFPLEYVGPPLYVYVTYILRGPIYGLADSWVIMGIIPRDSCSVEQIQPTTKRVKSLCWRDSVDGELKWTDEGINKEGRWKRFPIGDLEGDVEI